MTAGQVDELAGNLAAVWNLMGDYARFMDGRDAAALSTLFGASGVLAVGEREITGPAALEAFAAQSPEGVHTQGVPTVERQPDGGIRATSSFVFVNGTTHAIVAGEYRDDIVESGDGLVFARRQILMRVRS